MSSFCLDKSEPAVHLLLTSVAAAGHINPLIQLGLYLVEPRPWKPQTFVTLAIMLNEQTQDKVRLPTHSQIRVITKNDVGMESWLLDMLSKSRDTADELTPRVSSSYLNWPPISAVVFDFVSAFGQMIAENLKVPSFTFMASPLHFMWSFVRTEAIYGLHNQEPVPSTYDIPGIGAFTLPPRPDLEKENPLKGLFQQLCAICVAGYQKADGCLANDVQSLYSEEFLSSLPPQPLPKHWKVWCCGPLARKDQRLSLEGERTEAERFMDRFPAGSVLFVALGSCWSLKNQDLVELARGLEASGKPFVFAHRGKSDKDPFAAMGPKDTPAEEPTEADGLPLGFRDRVADRALITQWINQPRLLQHPALGAFMTHCGWNSILEGMSLGGVPFLLLPIGGDQQANADFLSKHLKCGLMVRSGSVFGHKVERDAVTRVIHEAFSNQELRQRARDIREIVCQESADHGTSERNTIEFFKKIEEASS